MLNKIKNADNDMQVYDLWSEAFGDTNEDIKFFLDNCNHKTCVGYYKNNRLVSMLFLVDCSVHDIKSKYVYAACTLKSCRSLGLMTKILDYCKSNNDNICLIPANDALIDYYNKREFSIKISINDIKFSETDEIKEYLLEGYALSEPCALMYKGDK